MADKKLEVPTKTFKVGEHNYKFLVPQFFHGTPYTAEEALEKPELLAELVEIHRKQKDKPDVHHGLIQLVESAVTTATKSDESDLITAIGEAKTEDEVKAIVAGDIRLTILTAASMRISEINKAK